MKIYMVRHGETAWNTEKRVQGQTDTELNDCGRKLAIKTGEALRDIDFDIVYSSPLKRAYETAQLIIGNKECVINKDERIKEISLGSYEGMTCDFSAKTENPPEFLKFFKTPLEYKPDKNGESIEIFIKRLESFLLEILYNPTLQDKTVLVVSHGAAIRGMLNYLKKNPIANFWKDGVHHNCAVTILNANMGDFTIEAENIVYYDDEIKNHYKM